MKRKRLSVDQVISKLCRAGPGIASELFVSPGVSEGNKQGRPEQVNRTTQRACPRNPHTFVHGNTNDIY